MRELKVQSGDLSLKKYMRTNSNMQQGKTCMLQLPVHYIYIYIDVVACAGPEVHVLHTNRFELRIPLVSANTRPQQHWLQSERERERERDWGGGGGRLHFL